MHSMFAIYSLLMTLSPVAQILSPSVPPVDALYSERTLAELKQIQRAALESDYAYRQTSHLANNIGPRLSGSRQAEAAVNYVADELKRLGLEVQLEEVRVPRWVRGEESAVLSRYSGQVANTSQKIALTALGGSSATAANGLAAE
jgi:carboxypeptidase Q